MPELWEVIKFEIRYQLRSPFFLGALLLFALIHFMAFTGVINLDVGALVAINSGYALLQTELVFFILGMLPVVAFVTTAITRDFEHATASLVYVAPISPKTFALGRFLGAYGFASLMGLAGLFGAMVGTFMPWLDQTRIVPFSLLPWVYISCVIILPGTFVLCAVFFAVAALTRSVALTWSAALAFFVTNLWLNLWAKPEHGVWIALADPSARLTVAVETRYWTAAELNTNLPWGLLLQNRLLWLTVGLAALALTLWRFRLDVDSHFLFHNVTRRSKNRNNKIGAFLGGFRVWLRGENTPPVIQTIRPTQSFSTRATFAQFISQLKMDVACVGKNPIVYLLLTLGIVAVISEFQSKTSLLETPVYPLTSLMLPAFRYGLGQYVVLIGLYYSAELIHRECTSGLHEIIHATPFPDWLLLLSKTATICLIVNALLLIALLASIALQVAMGFTRFDWGLYLQSVFVYHGVFYCLLCVLAVVIQTLAPNKWLGLLVTLGVYLGLWSLGPLGFDHPLYTFNLPDTPYSDMNGFGHFSQLAFALLGYWGAFCVLLLIVGHLFYPRGNDDDLRARWWVARTRIRSSVKLIGSLAALVFVSLGGWIFYNTNILNDYAMPGTRLQRQANYEKVYGRYDNAPAPSYDSINLELDLFPAERRLESRGIAMLGNHKSAPISEFVVSVKPLLRINQLAVENATLAQSDPVQGFYLFRLNAPLSPGAAVRMTWNATRKNAGFAAEPDNEIVANGTYLDTLGVMPIPGYDSGRRITDIAERRKYGLPSMPRVAKLGDPAYADKLGFGVDSRAAFEVVFSTSADQIAVAPGALVKEWQEGERRYFHYKAEAPILPNLSFCSARYEIARDRWDDVALEIYYDPKHAFNIAAMMESAKRGLALYSVEFAPYPYSYLRILEYPNYRTGAKFHSGTIPFSEATGFVNDLRAMSNGDYGVMHELAHLWWGERITGAQMQGRWMLTENMADYSTLMLFKESYSPHLANRLVRGMLEGYLKGRRNEDEAEVPVMLTENHGYLRAKGPHALYALQDIIGKDKVHQALRNFLKTYSFQTSPCPTSRDLINALRAETPAAYQQLITDLFERIVLYDLQVDAASVREIAGGFVVTIEITAKQFAANSTGKEIEEQLDSWFDVALFAHTDKPLEEVAPLYIEKHRLRSGKQKLTIRTVQKPGIAALDPFRKRIERSAGNNSQVIVALPFSGIKSAPVPPSRTR